MSQAVETAENQGEVQTELKRVMGPKLLLLFIVGDILGTGQQAFEQLEQAKLGEPAQQCAAEGRSAAKYCQLQAEQ